MSDLSFCQQAVQNANVKAFLAMIRKSEGTDAPDGYNYIFGSSPSNDTRFTDFSRHPNIRVPFRDTVSTAAGAYQILIGTWTTLQSVLGLPDFSPESQDIACVELLSERNCVARLMGGDFTFALQKSCNIWASLPGNNYGQPMHSVDTVKQWYIDAGGSLVA